MSSAQGGGREKKRFFASLHDLDQDDDASHDAGLSESIGFLKSSRTSLKRPRTAPGQQSDFRGFEKDVEDVAKPSPDRSLQRSASAPDPVSREKTVQQSTALRSTQGTASATKAPRPSRSSSSTGAATRVSGGKAKRKDAVQMVPEAHRIFRDLNFFFFPNDDANVPRRQRIQKAIAYGAKWSKDWNVSISHVIVDKNFNFDQLLQFLKLTELPREIVIVNETYPSDCMSYRCMLDPSQKAYKVSGHSAPRASTVAEGTPADAGRLQPARAPERQSSLPLKPPTSSVLVREPETPSNPSSFELLTVLAARKEPEDKMIGSGRIGSGDDLDKAIEEARTFRDLLLDSDDDEHGSRAPSQDGDDSDQEKSPEPKPRPKQKGTFFLASFQCMHKHSAGDRATNPNAHTIDILTKMAAYYSGVKDEWRTRAYRRAASTLQKQTEKVTTRDEALSLPFIGERLATKIQEIALTNRLRRLDSVSSDEKDKTLQLFTGIYGVGLIQASKWVEQGHRTLADLQASAAVKLTPNQEVGIAHYADFASRIPRDEVTRLGAIVAATLRTIDPACEVTIGGSYRRGAPDCGDIDLIITKPHATAGALRTVVVEQLVPALFASGFLKCGLAVTSTSSTGSKWHGACALPRPSTAPGDGKEGDEETPWRRIDFLLVPHAELGAALIYFTGNDHFNRSLRLLASKRGMRLNQRGLYRDVLRKRDRTKVTEGTLVEEGMSERRIFEVLGVPWREPEARVC